MGGRVCGHACAWTVGIRLYTEGSAVASTKALTSKSEGFSLGRYKAAQKVSSTVWGGASATGTQRCLGERAKDVRAHRFSLRSPRGRRLNCTPVERRGARTKAPPTALAVRRGPRLYVRHRRCSENELGYAHVLIERWADPDTGRAAGAVRRCGQSVTSAGARVWARTRGASCTVPRRPAFARRGLRRQKPNGDPAGCRSAC